MRRFLVLFFVGLVAALGIWYGLHRAQAPNTSSAAVTALLPKETLALAYVPDFKASRARWHETDLYKLWREPAMQEFLKKPMARAPHADGLQQHMREMDALGMRDAFLALIAIDKRQPVVVGGFRFDGSAADAENVIGPRRDRMLHEATEVKREKVTYEGHSIDLATHEDVTAATVYDGNWFFASNDLPSLKALLDRADKRAKDSATTLTTEENFVAAGKHLPASYHTLAYVRANLLAQKIADRFPSDSPERKRFASLQKLRSVLLASNFAEGKIHDVLFLATPRLEDGGDLARSSLALATADSFLYAAGNLQRPAAFLWPRQSDNGAPASLRGFLSAFAATGITKADWEGAFASELGLIGNWAADSRKPDVFLTAEVKDFAKAKALLEKLATATPKSEGWSSSEKDGVVYYKQPPPNPMVPVAPTIGLSNRALVAGLDAATVEDTIQRPAAQNSGLAATDNFKKAESWLPTAKQSFVYFDLPLFYQRLDAAVRPMLVMAALIPGISETVDLSKLPSAEVITRHLSPWVLSQRYDGDGYVTETLGPISILPAAIAFIGSAAARAGLRPPPAIPAMSTPPASAPPPPAISSATTPTPEPSVTPEESPSPTASPN